MTIPSYSELTNTQRNIANLPSNKNYVVTGAPGTGKTVIALYMAKLFSEQGKKVLFLVHNRPLKLFIDSMDDEFDFEINTLHSWLLNKFYSLTGISAPSIDRWNYDWGKVKSILENHEKLFDYIIFDEAQDFSYDIINALKESSTYTACYIDPHQKVNSDGIKEDDLLDLLEVRSPYRLLDNFRNTKEIFDFAKIYGKDKDVSSSKIEGHKPYFISVPDYDEQNKCVANIIKTNSNAKKIAVIANTKSLGITFSSLSEVDTGRDIFLYKSKSREYRDLDFSKDGVYVMSFNCVKGLEFDIVIITRCEKIRQTPECNDNNLFYIAATRAKKALYCIYFSAEEGTENYLDVFGPLKRDDEKRKLIDGSLDWNMEKID